MPRLLMEHLAEAQYEIPTPIQKSAIPSVMMNKDIMACAQTGSGKTAAFLLPIINKLMEQNKEGFAAETQSPEALIVAPTRELAVQIHKECYKFCRGSKIIPQLLYGGTEVRHQRQKLAGGCNILVGTPGRVNDFIEREFVSLNHIQFFVLDEADRMLDMGFGPIMEKLANDFEMPNTETRQTLLFSATFPEQIQSFAAKFLRKEYLFIKVGVVGGACSDVTQRLVQVQSAEATKSQVLEDIVKAVDNNQRTLVFVETKRKADFIACMLSQTQIPTTSIHGGRLQPEREKALSDFKQGICPIMVATSVAARGLDIPMVEHVINYELPKEIEEYVHRIGRTGRCGNVGLSTSFYDPSRDQHLAQALVKTLAESHQEVPDWLTKEMEEAKMGGNGYSHRPSRDTRDNSRGGGSSRSRDENSAPGDFSRSRPAPGQTIRKDAQDSGDDDQWGKPKESSGPAKVRPARGIKEDAKDSDDGW